MVPRDRPARAGRPPARHPFGLFVACCLASWPGATSRAQPTRAVLHPGPGGLAASPEYRMEVDGRPASVTEVTINPTPEYRDVAAPAAMACFDLGGPAEVRITCRRPPREVVVRPLSRGIRPVVDGDAVTFSLDRPGNFVVELHGRHDHPLFLFADPPEGPAPDPGDPRVIHFGPGVHDVGPIELRSGQTLHLAGGALVNGYVRAAGAEDIRITGRGVLHGGNYAKGEMGQKLITLRDCDRVRIEGIICLDSPEWNVNPVDCRDVAIENVKVIGWRRNSDAIDPVNADGLVIRDCFLKGQDDGVTLKGFGPRPGASIRDVTVEGTVFWNNWMRSMVVGGETFHVDRIENVVFRDCDVIHSGVNPKSRPNRDAALSVWNVDDAEVSGVLFERIRVEHADRLVRIAVVKNKHSRTADYGSIRGITFRDVTAMSGDCAIEISGHGDDHRVEDVTFENLRIGGVLVRGPKDCDYVANPFVRDVRFIVTEAGP